MFIWMTIIGVPFHLRHRLMIFHRELSLPDQWRCNQRWAKPPHHPPNLLNILSCSNSSYTFWFLTFRCEPTTNTNRHAWWSNHVFFNSAIIYTQRDRVPSLHVYVILVGNTHEWVIGKCGERFHWSAYHVSFLEFCNPISYFENGPVLTVSFYVN